MTYIFFISGIATRSLSFVMAILFARLMSPNDFGEFVVTNNNTLLWAMLSNYWLTTSAFRFMVPEDGGDAAGVVSTLLVGLLLSLCAAAALGFISIATTFAPIKPYLIPTAILVAALSMFADTTGACFTALANPKAYFLLNTRRAVLSFAASICFVLLGFGVLGAMIGQIFGLIGGLLERNVLALWRPARWRLAKRALLGSLFAYGAIGSVAFSLYMVIQVINRNFLAVHLDTATAGRFALTFDTFYAPIGLIGSSVSLGRMSAMHSGAKEHVRLGLQQIAFYIEKTLVFVAPYTIGGWLFAKPLVALIFGSAIGAEVADYAAIAVAHGAVMTLLSALLLGVLVLDRRIPLLCALIVTVGLNVASLYMQPAGASPAAYALATFSAMSAALIGLALWLVAIAGVRLHWRSLVLPVAGAGLMAVSIAWLPVDGPVALTVAIAVGAAVYAVWCEITGMLDIRATIAHLR